MRRLLVAVVGVFDQTTNFLYWTLDLTHAAR
jgi:hypothetical protein